MKTQFFLHGRLLLWPPLPTCSQSVLFWLLSLSPSLLFLHSPRTGLVMMLTHLLIPWDIAARGTLLRELVELIN